MELFLYLFRPFLVETHWYTVNLPCQALESELSTALKNNKDVAGRINGHFRVDGSIDLYLFSSWLTIRSWDPYPVRLKAAFRAIGPNTTELTLRVKPNAIFVVFTALFPLVFLLGWLAKPSDPELERMMVLLIPFAFFIFLMPYGAAYYKKAARRELEKTLGLSDCSSETQYFWKFW